MISANAGRRLPSAALLALAVLPLLGFWLTGVVDLDEGFYAAVTREMLVRGEWITPYYNGQPWFEKPILLYWLAIPSVAIFGETIGPRLPAVLCTIGTYFAIWTFARRYLGQLAADLSLLLVSGSFLMATVGRLMMTDLPLVLCEILAVLCFFRGITAALDATGADRPKLWKGLAALFLGLSVLAKGPVGCALFVALAGITYWKEPTLRPGFRGGWFVGTLVFALAVASWYGPAYAVNGQLFVQKFLIEQNWERFLGGDEAHTVPGLIGYVLYVPVLLLGTLPWGVRLFQAWPKAGPTETSDLFLRYCARWVLIVFLFFTLSSAKLPHYILPMIPMMAVVVGAWLAKVWQERGHTELDLRVARGPMVTAGVVTVLINAGMMWHYVGAPLPNGRFEVASHAELHALTRWARAQGGPIATFQMPRRDRSLGTGQLKVQETSHPSVVFYAGKPVLKSDEVDELTARRLSLWVLTRVGRFTPEVRQEVESRGFRLELQEPLGPTRFYQVYRLTPADR